MFKPICRTIIVVTIVLSISPVHRAEAFRGRRSSCTNCCQRCYAISSECLRTKIVDEGGGQFLYYADYYESGCGQDAQPDAWESGDETLPENCNGVPAACKDPNAYKSGSSGFKGLSMDPTDPDQDCCWSPCAQKCGKHYECLRLCGECKKVKVEVVTLWIPSACEFIHVALEVSKFPDGVNPCVIPVCGCNCTKCKKCDHAWSLRYCGKKVLLLTRC
jgi:hypothetical protein